MKPFDFDPSNLNKSTLFVGGVLVHVFSSTDLAEYVANYPAESNKIPINAIFLVHYRGGDCAFSESLAYSIEASIEKGNVPRIYVTFDARNHGKRLVDSDRNSGWKKNPSHGVDMILCIDGNVQDLNLIMKWLPSVLDLDRFIKYGRPDERPPHVVWHNVVCGVSLGGHTVFRFASAYPEKVRAVCSIVGCSDLTSLLVNRFMDQSTYDYKKYFYHTYAELPLAEQMRTLYPSALHLMVSEQDTYIYERFPSQLPLFAAFGADDTLVPPHFTKTWADGLVSSNSQSAVFVQPNMGHECTSEMVLELVLWLSVQFTQWEVDFEKA